jgi:hypothetical protein
LAQRVPQRVRLLKQAGGLAKENRVATLDAPVAQAAVAAAPAGC